MEITSTDYGFGGKVALVAGGGSGIGEATAKKLAAMGASVVVSDINDSAGERVVAEIESAGGKAAYRARDFVGMRWRTFADPDLGSWQSLPSLGTMEQCRR